MRAIQSRPCVVGCANAILRPACTVACTVLLAAAVLLSGWLAPPSFAQTQPLAPRPSGSSPETRLYRIAGKLTNSVTGEALSGATLTLMDEQFQHTIETAPSDADGHFQLEPVPAGKYVLEASRRGYITSPFDPHEEFSSAIVTGDQQDTEHIPFRLSPGAMVRGVVTDDAGEPVENASVLLVRKTSDGGLGVHLQKTITGETDDTGLFEFWDLRAGTYFLAVNATPWYALHPSIAATSEASEERRKAAAELDVAYPVTYYDSTLQESAATPIQVSTGERVQADVVLHQVTALHLTVRRPQSARDSNQDGNQNDESGGSASLTQTVFGDGQFAAIRSQRTTTAQPGETDFEGVAPGHYTVTQGYPKRLTEIDATGSQDVDTSAGLPTFQVKVRVQMADGSPLPLPMNLALVSDGDLTKTWNAIVDKAQVTFESVLPGKWNLLAQSDNLALAAVSILPAANITPDSRIVVRDRRLSLTVLLAKSKTNVTGFAIKDGKGQPGVMIVLAPKSSWTNVALFRRDQSDSDGSFLFHDVILGDYIALAIEDGWGMDWAQPDALRSYLPKGTPVRVTEAASGFLHLTTPLEVQAR